MLGKAWKPMPSPSEVIKMKGKPWKYHRFMIYDWLVVWNMNFTVPYWEFHLPTD